MSGAADVAQSILNVASDPCLVPVAQQLNALHLLQSESAGPDEPVTAQLGIGLCYAMTPLKVVVWARQNPWVFAALAGAVVFGIGTVGYKVGKRIHGGSKQMAGLKIGHPAQWADRFFSEADTPSELDKLHRIMKNKWTGAGRYYDSRTGVAKSEIDAVYREHKARVGA